MYFTADLLNFSFNAQPFDSKDCLFSSSWRYIESVRTKQYSRSSHRRYSMKKSVLRNFSKCTGKHLWQSLFFNKVAHLRPATLLKKRLWHRCFPVKFAKLLRTPFLQSTSGWLLLVFSMRSFVTTFWLPSSRCSEYSSLSSVSVITSFSGSNRHRFKDLNLSANSTKMSLSVSKELYRNFHQTILQSQAFYSLLYCCSI